MRLDLQKILFPKPSVCMAEALYYHRDAKCLMNVADSVMMFQETARCTFDSYFNGFSIGKWRKYTMLQDLKLELTLSGRFVVSIVNYELINGAIVGKVIDEQIVSADEPEKFVFSFEGFHQKGMHTFILMAQEDDSKFYGGMYFTELESERELNEVRIALNMCTYMREEYISRTVSCIRTSHIDNPDSPLYRKLYIYITDNAMTLDEKEFSAPYLKLTKQNAFGSVGGFTRGLLNILADREKYGLTHVLMLDDDIVLEPEVLCRTYVFFRLVKPEFREAWLGGGMLGLDFPQTQTESGGVIEDGVYKSLKAYLDVSQTYNVLYNEVEEGAKINAWWYCGIPLCSIDEQNLPYPVYFHCDDMEYASRLCKKLILMNGICVWHEEFFYKPATYYYDWRNREILFALHYPAFSAKGAIQKRVLKQVVLQILWYRYHDAEEILNGISDFLNGPEWLVQSDDREKFNSVQKSRFPLKPVQTMPMPFDYNRYLFSLIYPGESKWRRRWRKLTLNGWLLPAKHDVIVRTEIPLTCHFYRAKRVMNYSAKKRCAYMTYKSYRSAFRVLGQLVRVLWKIQIRYDRAKAEYRQSLSGLTERAFWCKRYGIKQEGSSK